MQSRYCGCRQHYITTVATGRVHSRLFLLIWQQKLRVLTGKVEYLQSKQKYELKA